MWMLPTFFLTPVGRWVGILGISAMALVGAYGKGYFDGRAAYRAKVERQIKAAVAGASAERERALRELGAGRVPDAWFRD